MLGYEICIKQELLSVLLMRTNSVPEHSWDADSEYIFVRIERKWAEFVGNKQIHSLTHKQI